MAGLSADRPLEIVLAARVARQFYLEGASKIDIDGRLGISRFRVARLLDSAREAGMVRIEIGLPGGSLHAGLSAELCSAFGLKQAFAFDFPDEDQPVTFRRPGPGGRPPYRLAQVAPHGDELLFDRRGQVRGRLLPGRDHRRSPPLAHGGSSRPRPSPRPAARNTRWRDLSPPGT